MHSRKTYAATSCSFRRRGLLLYSVLRTGLEMKLTVRPLTPDLWPALEELFGKSGACNGCWCMYWRIGSAYKKRPADNNKIAFRRTLNQGPPPSLLAFHGAFAAGW